MKDIFSEATDRKITGFIHQSLQGATSPDSFNKLALEIFSYQFDRNAPYRAFCLQRGLKPQQISSWEEIPAVPTIAFKTGAFCCFDPGRNVRTFETSGTTAGKKGRHGFDTLTLYDESARPNFQRHLLPDGRRLPMRILLPPPDEAPNSSLVYMCELVSKAFSDDARWYIAGGKLETAELCEDLKKAVQTGRPRMLLGATFSFVHFFDSLAARNMSFVLPAQSRIMETGGAKGKSREMTREEFLEMSERHLGISPAQIVNEYGMTELSSQLYDDTLTHPEDNRDGRTPIKIPPPWMKVQVIDPMSGEPAKAGEIGLIRIFDLANRGSAIAIQTEDIGLWEKSGLRVLGRARSADPRGCSRAIDEMLSTSA